MWYSVLMAHFKSINQEIEVGTIIEHKKEIAIQGGTGGPTINYGEHVHLAVLSGEHNSSYFFSRNKMYQSYLNPSLGNVPIESECYRFVNNHLYNSLITGNYPSVTTAFMDPTYYPVYGSQHPCIDVATRIKNPSVYWPIVETGIVTCVHRSNSTDLGNYIIIKYYVPTIPQIPIVGEPVSRNSNVNQIEIITDDVVGYKEPNGTKEGTLNKGFYNVLNETIVDDIKWYKLNGNYYIGSMISDEGNIVDNKKNIKEIGCTYTKSLV